MDRRLKKKVKIVSLVLLCGAFCTLLLVNNQKPLIVANAAAAPNDDGLMPPVAPDTTAKSKGAFADVEAAREKVLEDRRTADERTKKQNMKQKSVECIFWQQQKKTSSAASVDEKIAKFCNV